LIFGEIYSHRNNYSRAFAAACLLLSTQARFLLIGPRPDTRLFYTAAYPSMPTRALSESIFFDTFSNTSINSITISLEQPYESSFERFTLTTAGVFIVFLVPSYLQERPYLSSTHLPTCMSSNIVHKGPSPLSLSISELSARRFTTTFARRQPALADFSSPLSTPWASEPSPPLVFASSAQATSCVPVRRAIWTLSSSWTRPSSHRRHCFGNKSLPSQALLSAACRFPPIPSGLCLFMMRFSLFQNGRHFNRHIRTHSLRPQRRLGCCRPVSMDI
jgi:hypothetical protein